MKNKVIIALLLIVIVAGVIMATVLGFNKDFEYGYVNKIFIIQRKIILILLPF